MADLLYGCNPYEVRGAISKLGGQTSLDDFLLALDSDISVKLPNVCPRCATAGQIAEDVFLSVDCYVCYGKGRTDILVERSPSVYSNVSPRPNVV